MMLRLFQSLCISRIDPILLLSAEQRHVHQVPTVGNHCRILKPIERCTATVFCRDIDDKHHVFNANAKIALLITPGLVGECIAGS